MLLLAHPKFERMDGRYVNLLCWRMLDLRTEFHEEQRNGINFDKNIRKERHIP
jgi:hypothetical protein